MPDLLHNTGDRYTIDVVAGSPLWQIPAGATAGQVWAVACLTGSCSLTFRQVPAELGPESFVVLAGAPMGVIRFNDARAVLFSIPELDVLELPPGPIGLDELSLAVIHDVFFVGKSTVAHQLSALAMVCHRVAIPSAVPGHGEGNPVTKCLSYMERHLDEAISLKTLLDLTGVSRTQLLDRFRKDHGLSPMKALTSMRMEHARALLTQTDMTISQIAITVGYAELAAFTRAFTRQTGKPPSAYRHDAQWLV